MNSFLSTFHASPILLANFFFLYFSSYMRNKIYACLKLYVISHFNLSVHSSLAWLQHQLLKRELQGWHQGKLRRLSLILKRKKTKHHHVRLIFLDCFIFYFMQYTWSMYSSEKCLYPNLLKYFFRSCLKKKIFIIFKSLLSLTCNIMLTLPSFIQLLVTVESPLLTGGPRPSLIL